MNRKQFFKTLIGGVISAPIAVHELQSQTIPKLQPDGYKDNLKPMPVTGCMIDDTFKTTDRIGLAIPNPNHTLIVKSNNESRTK